MNKILLFGLLALSLSVLTVSAAAPHSSALFRAQEQAEADDDIQDVLYMGQPHPVLIRLRLQVGRKNAFAHWEASMGTFFAYLDRNDNKALDRSEIARALSGQQMLQLIQGNTFITNAQRGKGMPQSIPMTDFDTDRDGKVTLEEFCDYYRKNGAGPITLQASNQFARFGGGFNAGYGQPQDTLTDAVFSLLDTDKDGKLSKAELESAEKVLRKYDNDDDEMISMAELGLANRGVNRRLVDVQQAVVRRPPAQPTTQPTNLLLIERGDSGKRMTAKLKIARDLISAFDKDKDGAIGASEIGFSEKTFESIDRNKDGKLNALELGRWLAGKPAGEFTLRLHDQSGAVQRGGMMAPGKGNETSVSLDGVRINVLAPTTALAFRSDQFLLQQFEQVDSESKGFITRRQVEDNGQAFYLRGLFDLADRDADGKLTEKEMKAMLKAFSSVRGAQLHISIASTGQGLFQTIDANGDGRLSIRELRNVSKRLLALDTNKDGHLSRTEFPQQFQLTVSQGPYYNYINLTQGQATATPLAGPRWFRKMDRNADGDVSFSEWLGTKEQFDEIDTDKDGLIGLEEAEAYDARERKKGE